MTGRQLLKLLATDTMGAVQCTPVPRLLKLHGPHILLLLTCCVCQARRRCTPPSALLNPPPLLQAHPRRPLSRALRLGLGGPCAVGSLPPIGTLLPLPPIWTLLPLPQGSLLGLLLILRGSCRAPLLPLPQQGAVYISGSFPRRPSPRRPGALQQLLVLLGLLEQLLVLSELLQVLLELLLVLMEPFAVLLQSLLPLLQPMLILLELVLLELPLVLLGTITQRCCLVAWLLLLLLAWRDGSGRIQAVTVGCRGGDRLCGMTSARSGQKQRGVQWEFLVSECVFGFRGSAKGNVGDLGLLGF